MKFGKALAAGAALAVSLSILSPGAVLANGVGDLYVASPSGVLEMHVATATIVSTIPISPSPESLAFSPDGRSLYTSGEASSVTPIDIVTLQVKTPIAMPGPVSALAFPSGQTLVVSMAQRRTLAFLNVSDGTLVESAQLPGPGNILAGSRREARMAVAEAGANWLEVVDPGTDTMRKATVPGVIVALAIDRDQGAVIVATKNPDALLLVDLTSLATIWTVALPATPTAVAPLAKTIVAGGGTSLWKTDGTTLTPLATTKKTILSMTASDEGAVVHVAETSNVEVFDSAGALQRTLTLSGDQSPVAMAAVPRGSSLLLGQGAGESASPSTTPKNVIPIQTAPNGAAIATATPLSTSEPPTTSTAMDAAVRLAGSTPFQSAAAIGLAILFLCWLAIRWYDRRLGRR